MRKIVHQEIKLIVQETKCYYEKKKLPVEFVPSPTVNFVRQTSAILYLVWLKVEWFMDMRFLR